MITKLNPSDKKKHVGIVDFLANNFDTDFYMTHENKRVYITKEYQLKILFAESQDIYILEEGGDYLGLALIWVSLGGEKKRYYIKINAINKDVADDLLTQILWDYSEKELFVKIKKSNKLLSTFYRKNFKFLGGRGSQILLNRKNLFNRERKNNG